MTLRLSVSPGTEPRPWPKPPDGVSVPEFLRQAAFPQRRSASSAPRQYAQGGTSILSDHEGSIEALLLGTTDGADRWEAICRRNNKACNAALETWTC